MALPGLFVDRYADAAVMQTTSVAMDAARPALAEFLKKRLGVRIVVARDDGSARDFEGLPRVREVAAGEGATEVVYRLGENRLQADLLTDSKTGGFLDQADNHAVVAALAPPGARCLDAFTYHGGFALALARRQGAVLATDEDAQAVARAKANATRNHLPNLEVRQANAFELLRTLEADKPAFRRRGAGSPCPGQAPSRRPRRASRLSGNDPARPAPDQARRACRALLLLGPRIARAIRRAGFRGRSPKRTVAANPRTPRRRPRSPRASRGPGNGASEMLDSARAVLLLPLWPCWWATLSGKSCPRSGCAGAPGC
jgi:hypothetical protein